MEYWNKFEEQERYAEEKTIFKSFDTLRLLKETLSLFAKSLSLIKAEQNTNAVIARVALLSQNANNLKVSVDTAARGYYVQSMLPLRNVYENWLAFWYLAKFPNEADKWLDPDQNQLPPNAENMRKKIDYAFEDTKNKLLGYRKELNRFAHTDLITVITRLRRNNGNLVVRIGVEYHPVEFDACTYSVLFWIGNMLIAVSSWIPETQESWHKECRTRLQEINEFQGKFIGAYGEGG